MTLGLAYTRGRTIGSTTESGNGITRVAGQFAQALSCPIRGSVPHRVRIPHEGMITPTSGAAIIYLDPDNANGDGGQQSFGLVFDWRLNSTNRISLVYDKSGTQWTMSRFSGGAGASISTSDTFAAGAAIAVYLAWDATTTYVAVDGGTIASVSNSSIPSLTALVDIGSQDGSTTSTFFNAAYGAVLLFAAPITAAQWQGLAALRSLRPPVFGEWAQPSGMWLGAHSQVWTLPSTGQWLDFLNTTNLNMEELADGGVAPVLHRQIETPLRDGATYVDSRLRPRRVGLTLSLQGTSVDSAFDLRRQVTQALNPRRGQGLISFAPYDNVYEITAMPSSLPFSSRFPQFVRGTAEFLCTDPLWRKLARAESLASVPQGGWSITWSIPWTITESAVTQAVTNEGDVDAYPTIVVTAGSNGCTGPYVENITTGELFRLQGLVLAANEVVTINMDARTAVKADGTNVIGYRTDASRMWALVPGSNSVKFGADSGSATMRISHPTQLVGV